MSISTRFSKLEGLSGWRAWLACYVSGVLMILAFAPIYAWPVIFLALPVFYQLLQSASSARDAARRGFFFGYGHAMAGTYWIANALLVDVGKFGWLIPFSVLGLSAVMALWFALFGWFAHKLRSSHELMNIVYFASLWVIIEYLRSIGMFGFPWNLAGYVALASIHVAQLASILGVFGLSFLLVAIGLLPLLKKHGVLTAAILIVAAYGYGAWRMPEAAPLTSTTVRIVQASIPQDVKWTSEGKVDSLNIHTELTHQKADHQPDVVIWSESAFPFALRGDSAWGAYLGKILAPHQLLLTGAMRTDGVGSETKIWNSLVAVDDKGEIRASYDKHQLVPFGEFMPLRDVLPLDKITPGDIDFSRGEGAQTIRINSLPSFSPVVCYEVIFPWLTVSAKDRPEWIVNVTNDAWYGNSSGPYQHFAAAQMRAIEQGLPLVRAANNGISAVIDPYGRVLARLALNERAVLDASLPAAAVRTLYSRFGSLPILIIALLFYALGFAKTKKHKK